MIQFHIINTIVVFISFSFSCCVCKNEIKGNGPNRIVEKIMNNRVLKSDSVDCEMHSTVEMSFFDSTICYYRYRDYCDSVEFEVNYKNYTIEGNPFIATFWNSTINDSIIIEFEVARPPLIDCSYFIGDKAIKFTNDSTTSLFIKYHIKDLKSHIDVQGILRKEGEKEKVFHKKIRALI